MPALATMPYSAYLDTPHWQKVRALALRRAARHCQVCGARGKLDVHHNTYARRGRELPSDVVALCRSCHDLYHARRTKQSTTVHDRVEQSTTVQRRTRQSKT